LTNGGDCARAPPGQRPHTVIATAAVSSAWTIGFTELHPRLVASPSRRAPKITDNTGDTSVAGALRLLLR